MAIQWTTKTGTTSSAPVAAPVNRYDEWFATRDVGCNCFYCEGSNHCIGPNGGTWLHGPNAGLAMIDVDFQCQAKKPPITGVLKAAGTFVFKLNYTPTGFNCKKCNERNEYAAANRPDGTYVCFNCRG